MILLEAQVIKIVQAYYITTRCPYCSLLTSGATIKKVSERCCRHCKKEYNVVINST